jgi:broad specificity polyphosphatase/5'/3'-nucleotidase SurE
VNEGRALAGRPRSYDFSVTARHAADLAAAMAGAASAEPVVLSLNYPSRLGDLRPVVTRPGRRAYPRVSPEPWAAGPDERSVYLFGEPDEVIPEAGDPAGTDIAALREGRVSLTPLSLGLGAASLSDEAIAYLRRVGAQLPDSLSTEGLT